jgi:hypothetical protein
MYAHLLDYQGFLNMRQSLFWHKRYGVLRGGKFAYFKKKEDAIRVGTITLFFVQFAFWILVEF